MCAALSSSMNGGADKHVLRAIVRVSPWRFDAPPLQELAASQPAVGPRALEYEHAVIRQEEHHHKAAHEQAEHPVTNTSLRCPANPSFDSLLHSSSFKREHFAVNSKLAAPSAQISKQF